MRAFALPSLIVCSATALLGLAGCQPAGEQESMAPEAEERTMENDEAAIRTLADRYASSWNDGDASGIASLFAADGDLVGVEGRTSKGRAEVEARLAEDLSGMFQGTQISITTSSVRFLAPTVAVVDGSFEVTGMTGPGGEAAEPSKGLYTDVVVKQGDEWMIESLRPMVPQPAPSASE